jgi:hypothetical protein
MRRLVDPTLRRCPAMLISRLRVASNTTWRPSAAQPNMNNRCKPDTRLQMQSNQPISNTENATTSSRRRYGEVIVSMV